ncbi:MAG: TolC family protein [Candidatus Margulisiibacteriota bacterium]|jgi:outer membrane protein TolC
MKYLWSFIFCLVLVIPLRAQTSDWEALAENILSANPDLAGVQKTLEAARRREAYSGSWNDPKLSLTLGNKQMIGLSQAMPNWGKQALNVQIAAIEVRSAELQYEALSLDLRKQVLGVLYKLSAVEQSIRLAKEEKQVLESMRQTALRQYETGLVSQQDPIRVNLTDAELTMRINGFVQQKNSLQAELRQLASGAEITLDLLTIDLPVLDDVDAAEYGITKNPKVLMAENEYQKALLIRSATEVVFQPEFDLGAEYDLGMNSFNGMVGMSLPVWGNRNTDRLAEADAQSITASKNYQAILLNTRFQLETAKAQLQRVKEDRLIYQQTILPQSQAAFTGAEAGYLSGKLKFSEWLEARTRSLEARMALVQLEAEQAESIAELDRINGR